MEHISTILARCAERLQNTPARAAADTMTSAVDRATVEVVDFERRWTDDEGDPALINLEA